jgi:hypothetical protein
MEFFCLAFIFKVYNFNTFSISWLLGWTLYLLSTFFHYVFCFNNFYPSQL